MRELFSPSWYRLAKLKPRLRSHIRVLRQQYRGGMSYVLHDRVTCKFHQFNARAYCLLSLMNGRRTVQEIWEVSLEKLEDQGPTQQDVTQLLSQLHAIDALVADELPDTGELYERSVQHGRRQWQQRLTNVFAWRLPLYDPDRFLSRLLPVLRPLLTWWGALAWTAIVTIGVVSGVLHLAELSHDGVDQVLSPHNVLLLWLLFPLLKLCHEMGHAAVTKAFGGEVHELGVMILVFTPVPYVDASSAWAFRNKWHRILVGAAGMAVELILAACAVLLWVSAEQGILRMAAYNTILIAGVSTVFFNANPLMRFDGYYMLMDFLELPNLQQRATRYCIYLYQRYALGHREARGASGTTGERAWFFTYGVSSTLYRVIVVAGILLFLGEQMPVVALAFAALSAVGLIIVPLVKGLVFLLRDPRLHPIRSRAIASTVGVCVVVTMALFLVPVPFNTTAEGVVWLPDEAFVRAGEDGFVAQVVAAPGSHVAAGEVLFELENSRLVAKLAVLDGCVKELEAKRREQEPTDQVKMSIVEEELRYAREEQSRARDQVAQLTVRAEGSGTFVVPSSQDLPGRFIKQGDLLGHVVDLSTTTIRAIVRQTDVALVQDKLIATEVRLIERRGMPLAGHISRLAPAAVNELPSAALGTEGGGEVPVDPSDRQMRKAMQTVFHVDVTLPTDVPVINAGGRAYVRFSYQWEPVADQAARYVRQLFIRRLNV